MEQRSEYPFGKYWVYMSIVIVIIGIVFAIVILRDFILLLIYIAFTTPLTIAIFAYKFHIYFVRVKVSNGMVNRPNIYLRLNLKNNWKKISILCLSLSVATLFLPAFFPEVSSVLGGLIFVIVTCGLAVAANIPEIILYFFKTKREDSV